MRASSCPPFSLVMHCGSNPANPGQSWSCYAFDRLLSGCSCLSHSSQATAVQRSAARVATEYSKAHHTLRLGSGHSPDGGRALCFDGCCHGGFYRHDHCLLLACLEQPEYSTTLNEGLRLASAAAFRTSAGCSSSEAGHAKCFTHPISQPCPTCLDCSRNM